MSVGLIIKILGSLSELMLPYILSHILSDVLGRSVQDIILWGCIMIVCSLLACFLNISANRIAAYVSKCFAENMENTTVITVAQRVSSVKDSDVILVVDDGKIIGIGNHAHLLDNCEQYREISDSQMGGAFVD